MADTATTPTVVPHLAVNGGTDALAFYARAFGAEERSLHMANDGKRVMHAALAVNGGTVMLHDDFPEFGDSGGVRPPPEVGGASVCVHLQFGDAATADAAFARAIEAGCETVFPISDQFWGDRYGRLRDPFGHVWSIGAPLAS